MSGVCAAIVDSIPVCLSMLSDIVDLVSGDGYRRGCSVALEGGQMNSALSVQAQRSTHSTDIDKTCLELTAIHGYCRGCTPEMQRRRRLMQRCTMQGPKSKWSVKEIRRL